MIIHETQQDRTRERIVATAIERRWNMQLLRVEGKLSKKDFWMFQDDVCKGVLELKCRANKSTTYPTLFVSVAKYKELISTAEQYTITPIFAAAFTDGKILGVNVRTMEDYDVQTITRKKPRASGFTDPNDTEPVILVPIADMKTLGTLSDEELSMYAA